MHTIPLNIVSLKSQRLARLHFAVDGVRLAELKTFTQSTVAALGFTLVDTHFANGTMTAWVS